MYEKRKIIFYITIGTAVVLFAVAASVGIVGIILKNQTMMQTGTWITVAVVTINLLAQFVRPRKRNKKENKATVEKTEQKN